MKARDTAAGPELTRPRGCSRKDQNSVRRGSRRDLYAVSAVVGLCVNPSGEGISPQMIAATGVAVAGIITEAWDR